MIASLLSTLQLGALTLSLGASLAGVSGLALILVALVGLPALAGPLALLVPSFVKRGLLGLGLLLLVGSALYQTGRTAGVSAATRYAADKAIAAEAERARLSVAVQSKIAAQASADLAAEKEANSKLRELNDALLLDPGRDQPCIDLDLSRRLRDF